MAESVGVLILAAGTADRWTEPYPKQLAKIEGIPLLARTCYQLALYGLWATVLTHDFDIQAFIEQQKLCNVWPPLKHRWTCETLLSASPLWTDRTIVLLGDVVFSDKDLADVLSPSEYISIYHNADIGEFMALQFKREHHQRVKAVLAQTVDDAIAGRCNAKMWEWYNRIKLGGGIRAVRLLHSMDIDTVEDWHDIQAIYSTGQQDMVTAWAGVKPYAGIRDGGEQ